jgi:Methyl-accepting chemotaxis protein
MLNRLSITNISVSLKGFAAFATLTIIATAACGLIYMRSTTATHMVENNLKMGVLIDETWRLADAVEAANLAYKNFLLTGNRDFVTAYEAEGAKIDSKTAELETLFSETAPDQVATLKATASVAAVWRDDFVARQILMMRDPMTVELARAVEATGEGTARVEEFTGKLAALIGTLQQRADVALANQKAALASVETISLIVPIIVALVAIALGALNHIFAARPLVRLAETMSRLAKGDLDVPTVYVGTDEIGRIAATTETFKEAALANRRLEAEAEENRNRAEAERIAAQERAEAEAAERLRIATSGLAHGLQRLASGDLSFQLEEPFAPDFEALRHDFNSSVAQLRTTLSTIAGSIAAMEAGTREIAAGADDLSRRTEQQAASLEETAAAVEEITANVVNSTRRTEEARGVASHANISASESSEVVAHAEDAMRKIEESAQQISNIIGVIDEIAFQTNLLALNAGVEAARAGEAGKGFAVVAQEVRELAQRSANAAKEIKQLIENSTNQVAGGVELVRKAGDALRTIGGFIAEMNTHMDAIVISAKEQSTGLSEVNQAVNAMDQTTQQNAAMVEQSNAASATLANEAAKLRELVAQFRLGDEGAQASALRQMARTMAEPAPAPVRSQPARVARAGGASAAVAQDWAEF